MKTTLENDGTVLVLESEPSDRWQGKTTAERIKQHPQAGKCIECGFVRVGKKTTRMHVRLDDKPELAAMVEEWEAARQAAIIRAGNERLAAIEKIRNGETMIELYYHDGEYLSGHMVKTEHAANLLCQIGAAKEVSGWGVCVDYKMVEAIGESFRYPEAVEFTQPAREAEETAKAKRQAERDAIFAEAREAGERQKLRSWITNGCRNGNNDECSFDSAVEWAMPDGSRKITYTCCY